ncbi:sulfatase family protein [Algisphaera agarilytica]|uniref:Arylsulfatase A-like enzyme n=1 Tax=Algisphaera agarilytica TaxID=1385975 RepID=A0A7X0HAP9_9BACT|nr:sulfatase [Algisphaera agarilytica]MBB6431241.1 arylsulfatase A-like enzyme [Algisphaera agarilytica]
MPTTKPNILFIMSDDHGANAISAYGSRLASVFQTPNLDRIAREGVRLNNCHCGNAICTPSRATIFTGQHSHINGVRTLSDSLDTEATTYPKMMQAAGYQTAIFGKWHVHSEPQGFDQYYVLPGQGYYSNPFFIGPDHDWGESYSHSDPGGDRHEGYVTDLVTDFTLDYLKNVDKDRPFMVCCHHKAPHDDFEYHPRHEYMFDGVTIPEPDNLWEDHSRRDPCTRHYGTSVSDRNPFRNAIIRMSQPDYVTGQLDVTGLDAEGRTKAAYQKYLKDYMRTCAAIDENVGRLLDYLDGSGLAENTLVVYTSDQGMFLGEHDYIDKRWIYEEALQMPMLVRLPGEIPAGSQNQDLITNVDFASTLLDYAGIASDPGMQGRSFRSNLQGQTPEDWTDAIYYRYWMHMTHHHNPAHYGIRTQRYKLIHFYGLPLDATDALPYSTPPGWELYDLEKDPDENHNVYSDPEYADVVEKLKARLFELKAELGDEDEKYPEVMALPTR